MKPFLAIVLSWAALSCPVLAQEAVATPLPGAEIQAGEVHLNGSATIGTNLARDFTILGFQAQGMYSIDSRFAVNGKVGYYFDIDDGTDYDLLQIGGDLVWQLLEMTRSGAPNQPALSLYGGFGVTILDFQQRGRDFDDVNGYLELGIQGDLIPNDSFTLEPFAALLIVFSGHEDDAILAFGAKAAYKAGDRFRLEAGLTWQTDGFSSALLFTVGLAFKPGVSGPADGEKK